MIIKNKSLFFIAAAIVAFGLYQSGDSNSQNLSIDTSAEYKTELPTQSNANSIQTPNFKKINKIKRPNLKRFVRRASKNNFSQKMAAATSLTNPQNGQEHKAVPAPGKGKQTPEQKKKAEEAKKKKIAAEKKKKDEEDKKKALAKLKPVKGLGEAPNLETKDSSIAKNTSEETEGQSFSSTVTTTSTFIANKIEEELTEEEVAEDNKQAKNEDPKSNPKKADPEVKSLSIFANLLAENKFTDFEQLLKTDLTEDQRVEAYNETLKALLTKTGEDYLVYDSFLRTQFQNHDNAVVISRSIASKNASEEAVEYSVQTILNPLVLSWSEEQNSDEFKKIYQESVSQLITNAASKFESVMNLQNSIQAKYTDLFPSSVELSAL